VARPRVFPRGGARRTVHGTTLARVTDLDLIGIAARLDETTSYTLPAFADVACLPRSVVYAWIGAGVIPPGRGAGGTGTRRRWTGAELRAALTAAAEGRRLPVQWDVAPLTRYRLGDRDPEAVGAQSLRSRDYRRELAEACFPPAARARVIALIGAGTPVDQAAAAVNVTRSLVYGRAHRDAEFGRALDDAGHALCIGGVCGSATAYRDGCRGTACRREHNDAAQRARAGQA